MTNICVITDGFPTPGRPASYTFLRELLAVWCDMGNEINVIYPVPYFANDGRFYRSKWQYKTKTGKLINVFQPRYLSFSGKVILGIRTSEIAFRSEQKAILQTIELNHLKPDILYSHFLNNGCLAGTIGQKLGIPSFCAFGESSLWSINAYRIEIIRSRLAMLNGIVSVSTENKRVLVANDLFREKDIEVFPNGVDHTRFKPFDKAMTREKNGIPKEDIIGIYTGTFSKSKGALRVQSAASRIPGLKMIYLGGGPEEPKGDNILFEGKVEHDKIPEWLGIADFFVLPTLQEGCCNAIIEAMACGLPIISSDMPFNSDILSNDMAMLIDPMDEEGLFRAMSRMATDEGLRNEYSHKSLEKAKGLDIIPRAENILDFMQRKCN